MTTTTCITKIKYDKEEVQIHYDIWNERTGTFDRKTLKSGEEPHPDFSKEISGLSNAVLEITEIDDDPGAVTVTGVSLSWKDGAYGAVITAQRELDGIDAPLNLNTPILWTETQDGAEGQKLPEHIVSRIERLIVEAERYLAGERKQQKLNFSEEAE